MLQSTLRTNHDRFKVWTGSGIGIPPGRNVFDSFNQSKESKHKQRCQEQVSGKERRLGGMQTAIDDDGHRHRKPEKLRHMGPAGGRSPLNDDQQVHILACWDFEIVPGFNYCCCHQTTGTQKLSIPRNPITMTSADSLRDCARPHCVSIVLIWTCDS